MNERKRKKVILDVNAGSDNDIAIMAALKSNDLEVLGICTVFGDVDIDESMQIVAKICQMLKTDVRVYAGCSKSMVKELTPSRSLCSDVKTSLNEYTERSVRDNPKRVPEGLHAIEFYYKSLMESIEPISIITLGPLTNLGFLFRMAPELVEKVEELIIMGGGVNVTNATDSAEVNVWRDPEALQIVLEANLEPLLVTLDAANSMIFNKSDVEVLQSLQGIVGKTDFELGSSKSEFESEKKWSSIQNTLAVCACINPSVLTNVLKENCRVECTGLSDGELLIDRRAKPEPPNTSLAVKADKGVFVEMLCELFAKDAKETSKSDEEETMA